MTRKELKQLIKEVKSEMITERDIRNISLKHLKKKTGLEEITEDDRKTVEANLDTLFHKLVPRRTRPKLLRVK